MKAAWSREAEPALAADRLLDAAAVAFAERGVARTGMAEVASAAGCSRGTVYRYFASRHELHVAFVRRAARRIAEQVAAGIAAIEQPEQRLVEAIVRSVRAVRADPALAAWFAPGEAGVAARMSRASGVVDALSWAFVGRLAGAVDVPSQRLYSDWLVRVVISLLTLPGESEAAERELVERFVAPGLRSLASRPRDLDRVRAGG